ncbi:MAG: glycosyltransferase family 4 protein [Legionellales bacterium]
MKLFNAMFSKVNGGLEQVFLNYIPALTQQGNTVISIIHPDSEIRAICPKDNLITVHNYNQHDFFAVRRLRKLIEAEQPSCVITHSYRAAYLFKKTRTKVPKIAVCHVRSHYDFGTDAIIAITEKMRQDIIESGQPASTVFTVPNMVHIPKELTYNPPRDWEIPVIGVCARFADIKGVDIFLEALGELKKRQILFKARIAGDGKEKERYIKLIHSLNLHNEVTLLGWVDDRESFYKNIDIFCLPSREEAFGLVVLESMMHSLPMVLAELSGPIEIVGDSQSALLVPPCNPQKMADGLEALIHNKKLATELASNAFKRVQHYSSERVGPILHEVLEQVCGL